MYVDIVRKSLRTRDLGDKLGADLHNGVKWM